MTNMTRWYAGTAAALVAAFLIVPSAVPFAAAQSRNVAHTKKAPAKPAAVAAPQPPQLPPRIPFTAAEQASAAIPDMPDARFWADSVEDFKAALPQQPGPWPATRLLR